MMFVCLVVLFGHFQIDPKPPSRARISQLTSSAQKLYGRHNHQFVQSVVRSLPKSHQFSLIRNQCYDFSSLRLLMHLSKHCIYIDTEQPSRHPTSSLGSSCASKQTHTLPATLPQALFYSWKHSNASKNLPPFPEVCSICHKTSFSLQSVMRPFKTDKRLESHLFLSRQLLTTPQYENLM